MSGINLLIMCPGGGEVTALAAVPSRHNATTLLSGHGDGAVRKHTIELRAVRWPADCMPQQSPAPAAHRQCLAHHDAMWCFGFIMDGTTRSGMQVQAGWGAEPPSSGMAAAVISYEVAAVHPSSATLPPPSAVQQPAQSGSGQCQAEGGGGCRAADSGTGSGDVGAIRDEEPGSSDGEQGSAAAAAAAGLADVAAEPAGSATQAAGDSAAVRHIVTLKKGREWRFAAIWRDGGIAVWREDGAGRDTCAQPLRYKHPAPLLGCHYTILCGWLPCYSS